LTDRQIVQSSLAQLPWYHHIALLEKLDRPEPRLRYAARTLEHGWSRNILALQIDGRAHERHGKAFTNFKATLPPADPGTGRPGLPTTPSPSRRIRCWAD
jgi:predicted nuclease of restriction endonuclease-like (RecB) superfamily